MSARDKSETGSKFWNEGKFNSFVKPLLPEDCKDKIFVDVGCNAGLFLKMAEDMGFADVIGVDSNKGAIEKGLDYRKKNGGKYRLILQDMEKAIDDLPVSDYLVMANVHYYFELNDWLRFMDKLAAKTMHCIIVTVKKMKRTCMAPGDEAGIKNDFRQWELVDSVGEISRKGDPFPRRLSSFCFKSPLIEKVGIKDIWNANELQNNFYKEIDAGIFPEKTEYYRTLRVQPFRAHWSKKRLLDFISSQTKLYKDIKANGVKEAVMINSKNKIVDGNHRAKILEHLGYEDILVRKVL